MTRSNLHKGYQTLHAAKAFALLDPDTKGATNADGTKTIEEELSKLGGVKILYEEEFSSRKDKAERQRRTDEVLADLERRGVRLVLAKRNSKTVLVQVPRGVELDYEKEGLSPIGGNDNIGKNRSNFDG